jgi:hypothetical protein
MILKIYIEKEPYPHIMSPLSYITVEIINPCGKKVSKLEVIDSTGEMLRSINCSCLPRNFERLFFHSGWIPEMIVDEDESYVYDPARRAWIKKHKRHADAAFLKQPTIHGLGAYLFRGIWVAD